MNLSNLKKLIISKKSLTLEHKKKVIQILKEYRKTYKSLICEDENSNINIISKKFNTNADFDSYVAQHRGLQILPKEKQTVINYKNATPIEFTDFYIKYESTDDFSNNNTTVVKKLKEGNQYCWTAFSKNQASDNNIKEADEPSSQPPVNTDGEEKSQDNGQEQPEQPEPEEPENTIQIIKSIPFVDEMTGSKILSEFLIKLDI